MTVPRKSTTAALLGAIDQYERAYNAWVNSVPKHENVPCEGDLYRAFVIEEAKLIAFPCRSYADIGTKTGYFLGGQHGGGKGNSRRPCGR